MSSLHLNNTTTAFTWNRWSPSVNLRAHYSEQSLKICPHELMFVRNLRCNRIVGSVKKFARVVGRRQVASNLWLVFGCPCAVAMQPRGFRRPRTPHPPPRTRSQTPRHSVNLNYLSVDPIPYINHFFSPKKPAIIKILSSPGAVDAFETAQLTHRHRNRYLLRAVLLTINWFIVPPKLISLA